MKSSKAESVTKKRAGAGIASSAGDSKPQSLKAIPAEVIELDDRCGDPSAYLNAGETVLEVGSGTGKRCFIAAQIVGPEARVIGVEMTDSLLEVARRNAPQVAEGIGYANVEFLKGRIQDLALDLQKLDAALSAQPATDADSFLRANALAEELRATQPLIAPGSIDVVISTGLLYQVPIPAKPALFKEIFRVLRKGGRAVISDLVSDEFVPAERHADPEFACESLAGVLTEDDFLEGFNEVGFYGIRILKRDIAPCRVIAGIEYRSVTVEAFKGKEGQGLECNQAVIYKGPFKAVLDDDENHLTRGVRHAVSDKTFELFSKAPYREFFELIEPAFPVPRDEALPFDTERETPRHPKETKGEEFSADCSDDSCDHDHGCC